jgi:hypothetical protein
MFPTLQLEVMDRFTAVEAHFKRSQTWKGDPALIAKGLMFVQIYAIYEYTVKGVMRAAIQTIATHSHAYSDLRPSLLAVFLDPELRSLRDCMPGDIWDRRMRLLERSISADSLQEVSTLPMDGTHFRHSHILLILKTLGIRRALTARKRHLYMIDDVVDKRNSVSHGDATAVEVGRRYSRQEIARFSRVMKAVCLRLIKIVSEHCSDSEKHCR